MPAAGGTAMADRPEDGFPAGSRKRQGRAGNPPSGEDAGGSTASWSDRVAEIERQRNGAGGGDSPADFLDAGLGRLRQEAARTARRDAQEDLPDAELPGVSRSESALRERCRAFWEQWQSRERTRLHERAADLEQTISEKLSATSLSLDRFERLTNELCRLKARRSLRRRQVDEELSSEKKKRPRGLRTALYLPIIGFLGVVEFFANAPVFTALLPRDVLTERQIQLVAETSQGWMAGAERVFSQLILRPDAALLAAGVVTFLCVLAHFFGHSLRELVMQRDRKTRSDTVTGRSPLENVVPMALTGLGLVLVLGVLYEARVTLGDVGEERYEQDIAVVEELRREAGWLRVDGDLLAANESSNRAEDMEAAAGELREYASSMSRLSFPILLLNLTLVLCAISAAYFHRRDRRREHFNEDPFEEERREYIDAAEEVAREVSGSLSGAVREIRNLKNLLADTPLNDGRRVVHALESVVALYRAENGRARGLDSRSIPAFSEAVKLDVEPAGGERSAALADHDPGPYQREQRELKERFEESRARFNRETTSW